MTNTIAIASAVEGSSPGDATRLDGARLPVAIAVAMPSRRAIGQAAAAIAA
jgi:hypothetical protein